MIRKILLIIFTIAISISYSQSINYKGNNVLVNNGLVKLHKIKSSYYPRILSVPPAPTLVSPKDTASDLDTSLTLVWNSVSGAGIYEFQISDISDFNTYLLRADGSDTTININQLTYNSTYYWRVRAENSSGYGQWSETWSFTTKSKQIEDTGWWQAQDNSNSKYIVSLNTIDNETFAGTLDGYLYRTTDSGNTWQLINNFSNSAVYSICKYGSTYFVGTKTGIYTSIDLINWSPNYIFNNEAIYSLATNQTYILAGTNQGEIYRSSDGGNSWVLEFKNNQPYMTFLKLAIKSSFALAASNLGGVFMSTDNGNTWAQSSQGITSTFISSVAYTPTSFIASSNSNEVYRSTDNGVDWKALPTTGVIGSTIKAIAIIGENIFAGTTEGVSYWDNNKSIWKYISFGIGNGYIQSLAVNGEYLFAGTYYGGIWRRNISDIVTGIKNNKENPAKFALLQNYPNPFNPTTTINYSIPKSGLVTIKIYDIIGREIETLVNEQKNPGNYSVEFNANKFASGVYFYRIQAGDFVATKKLVLMK